MHLSNTNIVILGIVNVLNSIRTNLAVHFFLLLRSVVDSFQHFICRLSILADPNLKKNMCEIITNWYFIFLENIISMVSFFSQTCFIFTFHYGNSDDVNSDVKSRTFDSFYGNSMNESCFKFISQDFVEFNRK